MLEEGIYLAPSSFEAGFVSSSHSDDDISSTINATKKIFKKIDKKYVNINSSQEDQILKKITIN